MQLAFHKKYQMLKYRFVRHVIACIGSFQSRDRLEVLGGQNIHKTAAQAPFFISFLAANILITSQKNKSISEQNASFGHLQSIIKHHI